MTHDLYSADKVNELEKRVLRLEKVVAQLVARETNKQRELEEEEIRQMQLDEDTANIGSDL
jgi:hypothetical protein